jgi:hypothetical protein
VPPKSPTQTSTHHTYIGHHSPFPQGLLLLLTVVFRVVCLAHSQFTSNRLFGCKSVANFTLLQVEAATRSDSAARVACWVCPSFTLWCRNPSSQDLLFHLHSNEPRYQPNIRGSMSSWHIDGNSISIPDSLPPFLRHVDEEIAFVEQSQCRQLPFASDLGRPRNGPGL